MQFNLIQGACSKNVNFAIRLSLEHVEFFKLKTLDVFGFCSEKKCVDSWQPLRNFSMDMPVPLFLLNVSMGRFVSTSVSRFLITS